MPTTPNWNADYADYWNAAGDWHRAAIYCMAFAACNERSLVVGGGINGDAGTGSTGGEMPLTSVGDDVQAVSGAGGFGPGGVHRVYGVRTLQAFVENIAMNFAATIDSGGGAVDFDALDGAADGPDAATGGPAELWTWAKLKARVLGGATDWTRKYPREYAGPSAAAYSDGSAFADGHRARDLSTKRVTLRASGAWTVDTAAGAKPDVVTAYGPHQAGDYIGPWLFNEVRDCLNELSVPVSRCVLSAYPWDKVGHIGRWESFIPPSTGYNVCHGLTVANAKSAAEDAWGRDQDATFLEFFCPFPVDTPVIGDGNLVGGYEYGCQPRPPQTPEGNATVTAASGGGDVINGYSASLVKHRARAVVLRVGPPALARTVRFYAYALSAGTFDAQGSGLAENAWTLYETQAGNTDEVMRSGWINPDIETAPSWPGGTPAIGAPIPSLGWVLRTDSPSSLGVVALLDYAVPGGFRYTKDSTGSCEILGTTEVVVDDCARKACLARWRYTRRCLTGTTTLAATGERSCTSGVKDIGWVRQSDEVAEDNGEPIQVWLRWVVTGQACNDTGDGTGACTEDGPTPAGPFGAGSATCCPGGCASFGTCCSEIDGPRAIEIDLTLGGTDYVLTLNEYSASGTAVWLTSDTSGTIICNVDGSLDMILQLADGHQYWFRACSAGGCPPTDASKWFPYRKDSDPWDGTGLTITGIGCVLATCPSPIAFTLTYPGGSSSLHFVPYAPGDDSNWVDTVGGLSQIVEEPDFWAMAAFSADGACMYGFSAPKSGPCPPTDPAAWTFTGVLDGDPDACGTASLS